MTTTLTDERPIPGPVWDKSKPETRQPWLDFRAPGITATQIRDWGNASKRRKIIDEKVSGVFEDLSHLPYVAHGNRREPVIAEWAQGRFGITPCENTFARPDNPRHLASPDGISLDPFTRELLIGADAVVMEIKTSKNDLTPGLMDEGRHLIEVGVGSPFDRAGYYIQIQWQMYVMNATATLFVYEQHDDIVNPETGTFTPLGPPEYAWIQRDDALIQVLVDTVAPRALAEIDAARVALKPDDLPPASTFPSEDAVLVQEVVLARTAASTAETSRERAWNTLQEKYVGEGKPDIEKLDLGFAWFTVSTSTPAPKVTRRVETDWSAVKAGLTPLQVKKLDALIEKHTKEVVTTTPGKPTQKMTITEKKGKSA